MFLRNRPKAKLGASPFPQCCTVTLGRSFHHWGIEMQGTSQCTLQEAMSSLLTYAFNDRIAAGKVCNQRLAHSEKVQKRMLTLPTSPWVKNNTTHRNADLSYSYTCKSKKKKRLNNLGVESGIEVTGDWGGGGEKRCI